MQYCKNYYYSSSLDKKLTLSLQFVISYGGNVE